jgi:hypothetical protein
MDQPEVSTEKVKFLLEMEEQLAHAATIPLPDALIVLNWVQWQIIHFMAENGADWTVYTEIGAPPPNCPTCRPPSP